MDRQAPTQQTILLSFVRFFQGLGELAFSFWEKLLGRKARKIASPTEIHMNSTSLHLTPHDAWYFYPITITIILHNYFPSKQIITMSGKNKVDFLLEVVKGSTTTKQEQAEYYEPQVDGVCGGHYDVEDEDVTEDDTEIRDPPPNSSPLVSSPSKPNHVPEGAWVVRDFDFYGNPISERVQPGRPNSTTSNVNAVHPTTTVSPANSTNRQLTRREYTTEFSDGTTAPSCIVDFSLCLMNSLICSAGPCVLRDAYADTRSMGRSTQDDAAVAKIEAELQLELEKIQKQKIEMEHWYRREIARQDADRTLLQVQMEQKIVSMMEARISLEKEYRKEIAREVTEVRTLVNTQLDLGSRSDVSDDVVDITDAVIATNEVAARTSIPQDIQKPVQSEPCENNATNFMKSVAIVLTGTDEDSAIETEKALTPYPMEASE